jgi:hypothetical protein
LKPDERFLIAIGGRGEFEEFWWHLCKKDRGHFMLLFRFY